MNDQTQKISSLDSTDLNALRVKVAELCGFRNIVSNFDWGHELYGDRELGNELVPNYPRDLNACAEGFEKDAPLEYWRALSDITGAGGKSISLQQFRRIGLATAAQRCEAFVLISKPFGLKVNA